MRILRDVCHRLIAAIILIFAALMSACHSGGHLTADPSADFVTTIFVPSVTVATPAANPYYSNTNSVTITGMCQNGYNVQITGVYENQFACNNSTYSFTFASNIDGFYPFFISQSDGKSSMSTPLSFVWVRKSSIAPPSLSSPTLNPFLSGLASLNLVGNCETGATVTLSGDGAGSVLCSNSSFSLSVPKPIDGDYTIGVTQTDAAGNTGAMNLLWKKHILAVNPPNASVQVGTTQAFTFSGGSGVYNVSLIGSGGFYNAVLDVYTAGTVAGITDTLNVTDTAGSSAAISVNTIAGDADHLEIVSGDTQTQNVGTTLPQALKVKVVDRYGNAVAGHFVLFKSRSGDAKIIGNAVQLTDAVGIAQVNVKLGYTSVNNSIVVTPLFGPLPDLALSGNTRVVFSEIAASSNSGKFGDAIPVGSGASSMVLADFNGDGKKDVAIINANDPSIGILISRGNGMFNSMTKINGICSGPIALVTGDFNNDSKTDLAWLCTNLNLLQVSLGNGDGTFAVPLTTNLSVNENTPSSLAVGDFNADGKLDVAIGSSTGFLSLRFGDALGGFAAPASYDLNASPGATISSLAVANFDGVAGLDIVALDIFNNQFLVCLNNGAGVMICGGANGTNATSGGVALAVADFDGVGGPDLAILSNAEADIFLNDTLAPGSFTLSATLAVGTVPLSITAGDFNGDAKADILISNNGENTLYLITGDGAGGAAATTIIPALQTPVFALAQDLNGDARVDFIVSGVDWVNNAPAVQVLPGRPNTQFGFLSDISANPKAAVVADFNGDGKLDAAVVSASANTVSILPGNGYGLFPVAGATLTTLANPTAIIATDLRHNGKIDLVVTSGNTSTARVFLGNGDGTFAAGVDYVVGTGPTALIAVDINNDGNLDLAVLNQTSNSVSILLGDSTGVFAAKTDFSAGSSPSSLVAADLNNDNMMDIIITCKGDSTVSVLLGNGDGTLQTKVSYTDGGGTVGILADDVNNDGKIDVITANESDGTVTVLTGNGDGSFNSPLSYTTGTAPVAISSGDFNGDGKLDLIVADGTGMSFTILNGTAGGTYNSTKYYPTNGQVNAAVVGDFNNDGALDLLILDATALKAQTWLGF